MFISAFLFIGPASFGQDPTRFEGEIKELLSTIPKNDQQSTIVFTGSSSIRFWPELDKAFDGVKALNLGFGGSQTSDLIHYADELIISHNPSKIFIYEGDNDVAAGKSTAQILFDFKVLIDYIRQFQSDSPIYIISPKPSIARWNLKDNYLDVNNELKDLCSKSKGLQYIDVWTPMCDASGQVKQDIFIQDNLHMNEKGYAIWKEVIEPFVNQ